MKEIKKEALSQFHRANIIRAAEQLFLEKGIENTTMDGIAKEAIYSKATLYVYFKNKEEIISSITLISMKLFVDTIKYAISKSEDFTEQYFSLCDAMVSFYREHPLYYECLLRKINVDLEQPDTPKVYQEIFDAGEEINRTIGAMLTQGIKQGQVRSDIRLIETVFIFWSCFSGIISMTNQKNEYLTKYVGITKDEFLSYSFIMLLQSITVK